MIEKINKIQDQIEIQNIVINKMKEEIQKNKENCKNQNPPKLTWAQTTQQNTKPNPTEKPPYHQNKTPQQNQNKTNENNDENKDDDDEYETQNTKNRRKRILKKTLPTIGISPGQGEHDKEENTPAINYAKTTYQNFQKEPKIYLPNDVLEKYPEIETNEDDETNPNENLNEKGIEKLEEIINNSKTKIGFKPITNNMIKNEIKIIRQSGKMNMNNYNETMITATKNSIIRFMKTNLKMDEKTRNSISIMEIYPSKSETNSIIYIKCKTQDDISIITNHAKNLPKAIIGDTPPTIVRHVPKELFKRYQSLEKILWQIRTTKRNVLTNIQLGRRDYIIRYKTKDDETRWNDITPMRNPTNLPKPELDEHLYKPPPPIEQSPTTTPTIQPPPQTMDQNLKPTPTQQPPPHHPKNQKQHPYKNPTRIFKNRNPPHHQYHHWNQISHLPPYLQKPIEEFRNSKTKQEQFQTI